MTTELSDHPTPSLGAISSRLGFILISAGCAIGLGNVWRFPYIAGHNGGAAFVLIYLLCLVLLGIPCLSMELAIGRASRRSVTRAFEELEPSGSRWHLMKYLMALGPYVLLSYYAVITGWLLYYLWSFLAALTGAVPAAESQSSIAPGESFTALIGSPGLSLGFAFAVIALSGLVCFFGIKNGVERVIKPMLLALLFLLAGMAVYSLSLPGAMEGVSYYLYPDFGKMMEAGIINVVWDALNQAFFTLSVGQGSLLVFGSYIDKKRSILGESLWIAGTDTFVALMAGLIIFPACISMGLRPDAGPSLLFNTMLSVFSRMEFGVVLGTVFFVFMFFAAFTTVITVFENSQANFRDFFGSSRMKSVVINTFLLLLAAVPCGLGFNLWSDVTVMGWGILDFEDFIESYNILPLGSLGFALFVAFGWGYDRFLKEMNTGEGLRLPAFLRPYFRYVIPLIIIVVFTLGYYDKFFAS